MTTKMILRHRSSMVLRLARLMVLHLILLPFILVLVQQQNQGNHGSETSFHASVVVVQAASEAASEETSSNNQAKVEVEIDAATGEVTSSSSSSSFSASTSTSSISNTQPNTVQEQLTMLNNLVDWVNTLEGGYWNKKQQFKLIVNANDGDGDDSGTADTTENASNGTDTDKDIPSFGIFATEFIPEGTLLLQVPFTHIIDDEETDPTLKLNDDEDEDGGSLRCGTVRNLAHEMKHPQSSAYRPYVEYLASQPRGQIPSDWSSKGIKMFLEVLGASGLGRGGRNVEQAIPPVDPVSWIEEDWYDSCNGDRSDTVSTHAAAQVVQRSDDEWMIPVYDLYNHRNGKHFNTRSKTKEGVWRQIHSRRDILPGEEIYNSYNLCDHCAGRKHGYGTPELFRDYGFIEDYPQRWDFSDEFDIQFDLVKDVVKVKTPTNSEEYKPNRNKEVVRLEWLDRPEEKHEMEESLRGLRKELRRLYKVRHLLWNDATKAGSPTAGIPQREWDSLWKFHSATLNAVTHAINELSVEVNGTDNSRIPTNDDDNDDSADGSSSRTCTIESCDLGNHYHDLTNEYDDIRYNKATCYNKPVMQFPDYWLLEHTKTHYQMLNFAFRERDGDICMDLEDTLQICSCYRPHYHEFSAHFASRFVEDVKRIIFIGGGDSMLLHESLKFPNLEKVVGLELDQVVTRKSFKYFRTRPHFDDDRVEWWFGDATKSLLLLPEDYWGTFDLVLVDLSETVMAFSVTEHLDVFSALALLLNKKGVMVKNELYMQEMSEVFDYTASIHVEDNPKICSQAMAFGSNSADFFRQTQKDHMVETLALPPVKDYEDRFDYFHDYSRNNAIDQGKCNTTQLSKPAEQTKSAGILHVLDVEGVTTSLALENVEALITTVAKDIGLTVVSVSPVGRPDDGLGMALVVLQEGYVLARLWPDEKYVGLDIGMWGGFGKASEFQRRLGYEFNPSTLSSFRVVVGGMYGSSTWEHDRDIIGPQIVQHRDCGTETYTEAPFTDIVSQTTVIDEVSNLVASKDMVAAVVCGVKGQDECIAIDVLEKNPKIARVIPIYTCPDVAGIGPDDAMKLSAMMDCEWATVDFLEKTLKYITIDMLVLDVSAPLAMAQIFSSILNVPRFRDSFLSAYHFMMTWSTDPKARQYQRYVLEQYRKDQLVDPISRAELKVVVDGTAMEVGLLSVGDLAIFHNLYIFEKKLSRRLKRDEQMTVSVETRHIQGGLYRYNHQWKPKEYPQEAYDHKPADEQYASQSPLGREVIVQFELNKDNESSSSSSTTPATMPTWKELTEITESTLDSMDIKATRFETYDPIGEGRLLTAGYEGGNLVLVWDGREHVDLDLFLRDDSKKLADSMINVFLGKAENRIMVTLRDDFPRGTGRVVNFKADLDFKDIPSFSQRKAYVNG